MIEPTNFVLGSLKGSYKKLEGGTHTGLFGDST